MTIPIRELMLFEGIENSMTAICNAYNFPKTLLNYLAGATYANAELLKKSLYQDNIIPEWSILMSELNNFLGLPDMKLLLEADFSHIECLQSDKLTESTRNATDIATILSIQTAITNGELDIESGKALLKIIMQISEEDINQILSENVKVTGIQNQVGAVQVPAQ